MTEITRAQFAVAAVVVVLLAWTVGRAVAPSRAPAVPSASTTPTTVADAGEPGTAPASSTPTAAVVVRTPTKTVVVHVAGAVHRPGVYRLKDGARVSDAVKKAGGRARGADLDAINLAAKVRDGVQILVPRRGTGASVGAPSSGATASPGTAGGAAAPNAPIDLNTATAEELDTLDGVGPATASKILQYRAEHGPFRSVDDLEQIPGIGPKKLAAMRARVRV